MRYFEKSFKIWVVIVILAISGGCATPIYSVYGVPASQWNSLSNAERQAIIDAHNSQPLPLANSGNNSTVNQPTVTTQPPVTVQQRPVEQPAVVTQPVPTPVYYPYYAGYPYSWWNYWWYPSIGLWFNYRHHPHHGYYPHWRGRR